MSTFYPEQYESHGLSIEDFLDYEFAEIHHNHVEDVYNIIGFHKAVDALKERYELASTPFQELRIMAALETLRDIHLDRVFLFADCECDSVINAYKLTEIR